MATRMRIIGSEVNSKMRDGYAMLILQDDDGETYGLEMNWRGMLVASYGLAATAAKAAEIAGIDDEAFLAATQETGRMVLDQMSQAHEEEE